MQFSFRSSSEEVFTGRDWIGYLDSFLDSYIHGQYIQHVMRYLANIPPYPLASR